MSKSQNILRKSFDGLFFLIAAVAIIYFIVQRFDVFTNILIVVLGFGAVIIIHELGHFIVARICGITIEAFSIGFPPTLLGIQQTEKGIRFRVLPAFFNKVAEDKDPDEAESSDDGGISFTLYKKCKASDTEYRIGLFPLGGFVKMLGQEDVGKVKASDDPKSYANKPIPVRIAVVAAGVIFNALSAVLIFMVVFLIGIDLSPAVVGSVRRNSPAELAGIRPRDRIVEVQGEKFIDFSSLQLASMLTARGKPISMVVQHHDGTRESFDIIAEKPVDAMMEMRALGIGRSESLAISKLSGSEEMYLYEATGLRPCDVVTAFNGIEVNDSWELEEAVRNSSGHSGVLTVWRAEPETGEGKLIDIELGMYVNHATDNFKTGYDLAHIYTMIPRLKVVAIPTTMPQTRRDKLITWWEKLTTGAYENDVTGRQGQADEPGLEVGDIIVKVADIETPTYTELRQITTYHKDKSMPVTVLRENEAGTLESVEVAVFPKRWGGSDRVTIGILTALDAEHPVVAGTIDIEGGPAALAIPKGAKITAVDGQEVADFYDVMKLIRRNSGQHITIEYVFEADGKADAGAVELNIPYDRDYVTAGNVFVDFIPFEFLKEKVRATSAVEAIDMGFKTAYGFIAKTYLTFRRLFSRQVSPKTLMGPIAIASVSYKIVSTVSLMYYVYFLGLISCALAVMNLLPIPIIDGGVIMMLVIEKLKGSPVSVRGQEIVTYVGLALLGALVIYVTYNDILMWLFPQ